MKQYMNRLLTIVAVLLASAGAWAGEVTTIITPNNAGTVQVSQAAAGQTCTITVTPASGYYLTVENLSAVTTLDGGGVQAPSRRGIDFSEEQLTITAKTPDADPSGVTTYEFTMPADESVNVELTAAFQTLIAINPSVSLAGWTYGEQPNAPVVTDNTGKGEETFTYALQGSTDYTTAVPENAGKYTVKATIAAAGKYAAGEATADFEIGKAAAAVITTPAAIANLAYTGEAQPLITAGVATGGELQYKLGADGTYGTTVPTATAAGSYTVYYKVVGDANHDDVAEASINVTIGKAAATITTTPAAIANLAYTGEAQPLITAGVATGGELQYKLGENGTYGTTVPTATAAGTYTVYYKVVGDANHNDVAEASINVTIGQADLNEVDVAAIANQVYTGEAIEPALTVTFNDEAVDASEYIVAYTNNTNVGEATVTLTSTEKNFSAQNTKSVTFQITTASATLTATDKTVIYTGQAQAIEGVTASKGTAVVTYYATAEARTAGTGGTADAPTNAATYYVQVTQGDNNYASTPVNVTFTIEPKELTEQMVALSATSFVYSGEVQKPTVTVSDGDALTTDDYTITNEGGIAVGTYSVAVVGQNNYTGEVTLDFSITAAGITLTKAPAAIANLSYTGEAQALITAGVATGGELQYKLGENGTYGTTLPTATAAGTYKVFYKVVADANYADVEETYIEVTIEKANPDLEMANEILTLDAFHTSATYTNDVKVKLNGSPVTGNFTFTYESTNESVATVNANGEVKAVGVGEAVIVVRGPIDDANFNEAEVTYNVSVYTTYGITVYKDGRLVTIDNTNRNDVFGDGTVKYDGRQTLIFENAHFAGAVDTYITTSNEELKIFLKGENSFDGVSHAILNTKGNGTLTFTTEGNSPGTVTMKNTSGSSTAQVISGFSKIVFEQNLTILSGGAGQSELTVGTPIAPFVDDNTEKKAVDVAEAASQATTDLSNTNVNDVLFTLKEESDGTGDKVDTEENCIVLASAMVESEVSEAVTTYQPGTNSFAEAFQGLTFMVPAGTGNVIVVVKTGPEGVLHVKIGRDEPYVIRHALDFTEYVFPYACTEATYVYIYNASPVIESNAPDRRASKKTSITVGVRNVGAAASEVQSSNNSDGADVNDEDVVSEENVEASVVVENGVAVLDNANITTLPDDLFSEMLFMNSIDLRNTSVTGMIVSRYEGAFNGVSENTFIYMPTGNKSDEPNVVIGKICNYAVLDADMPDEESFAPSDEFTAQTIVLNRTFSMNEIATVYLPFAVSIASANEFGRFFTFDRAANGFVKLTEVTTDLQAHTPYVFQSKTDNIKILLKTVKVSMPDGAAPAPRRTAGDGMQGCYQNFAGTDAYCLESGTSLDDIHFVRMQAGDKVKAFQAYLVLEGETAESLRVTDNEAVLTGITTIDAEKAPAVWYSIDGKHLQAEPVVKGVYIHAGKKVVIP